MSQRTRIQSSSRSSRAIRAALTCSAFSALVSLGAAAPASAGDARGSFRVTVAAPAGKGCISSEKLEASVRRHVRGEPRAAKVDVSIQAADPGPGWTADVTVAGKSGRRTVEAHGAACSHLDEGLVLVIALLADPDDDNPAALPKGSSDAPAPAGDADRKPSGWGTDEPEGDAPGKKGEAEPDEEPEKGEPEKGKHEGGNPETDNPEKDDPEKGNQGPLSIPGHGEHGYRAPEAPLKQAVSSRRPVQFGFGSSLVYTTGLLPQAGPGVRAAVTWLSPTPVWLEAAFTYHAPQQAQTVLVDPTGAFTGGAWQLEAMTFELDACPAKFDFGRVHFGGCAGISLTNVHLTSWSPTAPSPDYSAGFPEYTNLDHVIVAQTADVRLDVSLTRFLRAGAGFQLLVPLNRTQAYDLGPAGPDHLNDAVAFQGRAGLSLVLPP